MSSVRTATRVTVAVVAPRSFLILHGLLPRSFLILHGLQASGPGHWQTWLGARLRADGERVAYPDLPDADLPLLPAWRSTLDGELAAQPAGEVIVVCHSLACLLYLHHVADGGPQADRVLFAAPPSEASGVAEINGFFPVPLPSLDEGARLVCSDNDPYCPEGAAGLYGEPLGIPVDLLPGRGHLNPEAGYGPWPAVERWCLDGDLSITE
jgi:predicted alpha/beta hydrolase family esterase